jgi:hypothetical protein
VITGHEIRRKGIMSMSELRELVVDAHGGIERWNKV